MSVPTPGDVLIFGAGNIGRGVVAARVAAAGYRPVLVVSREPLRRALAEAGAYTVHLVGESESQVRVSGLAVLSTNDADAIARAVSTCDFAAVSVGGHNLGRVAPLLAPGLALRDDTLRVLVCENMLGAERVLAELLAAHGAAPDAVRTVRTSVEPMFRPAEEPLDIIGESDLPVFVAAREWGDGAPAIPGFGLVEDVEPYYARKLFTNNAGHGHIAYLGARAGYALVHEAVSDPGIAGPLRSMLEAAADALACRYGLCRADLADHLGRLMDVRYPSRRLGDTIARLARDPLRKLGPQERLIGLVRLLQSCGMSGDPVCPAIAAALCYRADDDPSAPGMAEMIAEGGPGHVLTEVCGLQPRESAYAHILDLYSHLGHP